MTERAVLLHTLSREIVVALVRTEAWSVELIQDHRAFSELLFLTMKLFRREYNIVEFDHLPMDIMHKNVMLNRAIFEAAMFVFLLSKHRSLASLWK